MNLVYVNKEKMVSDSWNVQGAIQKEEFKTEIQDSFLINMEQQVGMEQHRHGESFEQQVSGDVDARKEKNEESTGE